MADTPAIEKAARHAMLTARCRIQDRSGDPRCIRHDDYVTGGMCETVVDIVAAGFSAVMGRYSTVPALDMDDPGYGAPLQEWLADRSGV